MTLSGSAVWYSYTPDSDLTLTFTFNTAITITVTPAVNWMPYNFGSTYRATKTSAETNHPQQTLSLTQGTTYLFKVMGYANAVTNVDIEFDVSAGAASEENVTYTVDVHFGSVSDIFHITNLQPANGATVGLYSGDELVVSGDTNEQGVAELSAAPGTYTVRIVSFMPDYPLVGTHTVSAEEPACNIELYTKNVKGTVSSDPIEWTSGTNDLPFSIKLMEYLTALAEEDEEEEGYGYVYASFTPEAAGSYTFTASAAVASICCSTNREWSIGWVASLDDGEPSASLSFTCDLEADQTYLFLCTINTENLVSEDLSYRITISKNA